MKDTFYYGIIFYGFFGFIAENVGAALVAAHG